MSSSQVTIDVEKLVYGGSGLARLNGQVVLVPFVLPGERVTVTTNRVNTGLLRASAPAILVSNPHRIAPGCEYFAKCGGCHYQQAEYAFQLEQKRAILRETLARIGGIAHDGEIAVLSGEQWHYRNRIQLHFSNGIAGFHRAGSHDVYPIDHCPISSPVLNTVISKLQSAAKHAQWPRFLRSLEIFTNEEDVQLNVVDSTRPVAARFFEWCSSFLPSLARDALEYQAAGHVFRISRGAFFQVNRFLIDTLVGEALRSVEGTHALDLYAGVGLFSVPLARRFQRVDAVERSAPACRDLEWNSRGTNISTARASAEAFLKNLADVPDLILADPPRAGLSRDAINELLRIRAPRLTLVSCDPTSLSRDLRNLLPSYAIHRLTLIDLFPQTYHFETVAHLRIS
jgi:23S rRNA (uracil1939-C5)-methyltransferase